ncbi:MAG: mechanosensitive ion channel family protein [Gammaproteobacteria bacterium]|jgi:small-conductance mechanosensitive channel|nr:mechanosensitive ion channel family protein [Gammaproteobacteria bacterium]
MQLNSLFKDVQAYPWLAFLFVTVGAVVVALIAYATIYAVLRRFTRANSTAVVIVNYTAQPAKLALPLLALKLTLPEMLAGLPHKVIFNEFVTILLTLSLTWLVMRIISGVGEALVRLNPIDTSDNIHSRHLQTQARVLARTGMFFVLLIGLASALMVLPGMQQIGGSLLASAGVAGIAAGIAARPVLGNLIAGLQIALAQPIRLDDVVIIENEWGRIEEITSTYVVVKIWDERRLIVPLQWIIENPFQNWTRSTSHLLGTVLLWLDYRLPLTPLREELLRVCKSAPEWDQRVSMIQVVDSNEYGMQIRALISAGDASRRWDLCCRVREAMIDFVQREYPQYLPRIRAEISHGEQHAASTEPAPPPPHAGLGDSTAIKQPPSRETPTSV